MNIKGLAAFALSAASILGFFNYGLATAPDDISAASVQSYDKCGDDLTWELDKNGTLTVDGTGKMYDFSQINRYNSMHTYGGAACPWEYKRDTIKNVIVKEGVTYIGSSAFEDCEQLKTVTILNPDCDIYASKGTISNFHDYKTSQPDESGNFDDGEEAQFWGTIKGYKSSTAEAYANNWKYKFAALGTEPPVTSTASSSQTVTTATTTAVSAPVTTTVTAIETGFQLSADELTMKPGQQYTINSNQSGLTYKSSDTDTVIVSSKGVVTAVSEGDAVITVYNKNFDAASITVRVRNKLSVCGDANEDGDVTIADAVAILQFIGNRDKYPLSDSGKANADVDGVAGITGTDALTIQKVDAGLIDKNALPLKQ